MENEKLKEYYEITNSLKTSVYALKWLDRSKNEFDTIISQQENLFRQLLSFGINNFGLPEEN